MNNENAKRLNFRKGSKPRSPSQTNGNANILIKSNIAIPKLQNLAKKYIGVVDPHGFLTDLRIALNIPNTKGVSKYGYITIPKEDGSVLQASLRITNHNSNANTYITNNTNMDYNLSIVVRNKQRQNTFVPHKDVVLDEYVYYGKRMKKVENPLTQIINSIIGFLQSGVYEDTTNVAFRNHSPQQDENNKLNCNIMKKNVIRLTESDLHRIIKESVDNILTELDWRTYANAAKKARERNDSRERDFANAASDSSHKMEYNDNSHKSHSSVAIGFDKDLKVAPGGINRNEWGEYWLGKPGFSSNPKIKGYYNDLEKQANDYNDGKSKYIKGKGWQ